MMIIIRAVIPIGYRCQILGGQPEPNIHGECVEQNFPKRKTCFAVFECLPNFHKSIKQTQELSKMGLNIV